MKQMSLGESGFERKTKSTRKREFLDEMNLVVPWVELVSLIAPHAPTPGARGRRPPFAVESMLRTHFLQQWFNLSDPAMEEVHYDMALFREIIGLDAGEDNLPDERTILRFRHLLETHNLSLQILATVNATLAAKGLLFKSGTVVDADSGLVQTVAGTAANVNDVTQAHALEHGAETQVFADTGYQGVSKREEAQEINAHWHVAMRPGKRKALDKSSAMGAILDKLEQAKARIRAKVAHPFRVIKRQFRHVKVSYRGLAKNTAQLHTLFALSSLWMARGKLLQEMRG